MLLPSASSSGERVAGQPTPATPSATTTQTATSAQPGIRVPATRAPDGTLRLRGAHIDDRRVRWDSDVIDNEGMGKKKSKVCCIYHRPRAYDESSSEEDSSSDESSDDNDDGGQPSHRRAHGNSCGHGHGRKPKNAYEKMPKPSSFRKQS